MDRTPDPCPHVTAEEYAAAKRSGDPEAIAAIENCEGCNAGTPDPLAQRIAARRATRCAIAAGTGPLTAAEAEAVHQAARLGNPRLADVARTAVSLVSGTGRTVRLALTDGSVTGRGTTSLGFVHQPGGHITEAVILADPCRFTFPAAVFPLSLVAGVEPGED